MINQLFEEKAVFVLLLVLLVNGYVSHLHGQKLNTNEQPSNKSIKDFGAVNYAAPPDDDGGGGGPVPADPVGTFNVSTNCKVITVTIASGGPVAGQPWFLHTSASHSGAVAFTGGVAEMTINDNNHRTFYVSARYGGTGEWSQDAIIAYQGEVHGNLDPNTAMTGPQNAIEGTQTQFGVSNSQTSAIYRLYRNNSFFVTSTPGTVNTAYFNNVNVDGTYTVKADFGCGYYVDVPGSRIIQEYTIPNAPAPDGTYSVTFNNCGKIEFTITNSNVPQGYGWYLHTGNPDAGVLFFNNKAVWTTSSTESSMYYVSAIDHPKNELWSAPQTIGSYSVSQATPAVRNMIGDPTACVGELDAFGVENSQSGVTYKLLHAENFVDFEEVKNMIGNNDNQNFEGVSKNGLYKVVGWYGNSSLGCSTPMNGTRELEQKGFAPPPSVTINAPECIDTASFAFNDFVWPAPSNNDNDSHHQPHGPDAEDGMPDGVVQMIYTGADPFATNGSDMTNSYRKVEQNGTYYVRTKFTSIDNEVCWSDALPITISSIGSPPESPIQSVSQNFCGLRTITLAEIPKQTYEWIGPEYEVEVEENQFQVVNDANYKVKAIKTEDCVMEKVFDTLVLVTMFPQEKTISGGGSYYENPEEYNHISLSDAEIDVDYQIFRGAEFIEELERPSMRSNPITTNGSYQVNAIRSVDLLRSETEVCVTQLSTIIEITDAHYTDVNFRRSKSFTIPVQEENVSSVLPVDQVDAITYYDGLGRPVESIMEAVTPSGQDLVQYAAYDELGRQQKSFLPYVANYDSQFKPLTQVAADQANFYQTSAEVENDSRPFTEVEYDNSPLNRVKSQKGVGADWHAADKKVTVSYLTNTVEDAVIKWEMDNEELTASGQYAANELYKTLSNNEDDHQVISFSNKWGQTVLKKVEAPASDGGWALTYYVYDDYGNLVVVIPPEASKLIQN